MNESQEIRRVEAAVLAYRMSLFSSSIFFIYLISVLSVILPPRILDPSWQLSSIKTLVDTATIPLLGLAILHLAAYLCPENILLQKRRNSLARLAILASLGFLLFIPLQGHAIWRSYSAANSYSDQQQAVATQRADAVRRAIEQSTSAKDLQKRLKALQGPELRIMFDERTITAIPLPTLKQQLLAKVAQTEGEFKARFGRLAPGTIEQFTRETLRVMASSLALAFAFSVGGQRKGSSVPFLVELPSLPGRLIASLQPRRARHGQAGGGLHFLKSPTKREEEFFESLAPPEDEPPSTR